MLGINSPCYPLKKKKKALLKGKSIALKGEIMPGMFLESRFTAPEDRLERRVAQKFHRNYYFSIPSSPLAPYIKGKGGF